MQLTDGATASVNPSWVAADMGALTHQCDAELAEYDAQLSRLASGIAALEAEKAAVLSKRQQVVTTREQALRVQDTLLAAAQAGVALRSGQRGGEGTRLEVVSNHGGQESAESSADESPDPLDSAAAPPTAEGGHAADAPAASDNAKLGPRGMQALQIINSMPDQQWTPKLLAVRLEGQEAAADNKAHNRARTLMDHLVKKQLVVKKYGNDGRSCYFVATAATEAA
ncbi:hypothetical protein ACFWXK_05660 [Streptomyces sp. NPDC059070]|uniref:hypothetical protein n=1 Tax=Streptomyces sp. NPDC059070 TaxID=3346713 RepID=UPI0036947F31